MKPTLENPWTAVPFGNSFNRDCSDIGFRTKLRLARLVNATRCDGYNIPHVLLSAGFPPLLKRNALQTQTMASMMKSWLIEEGTFKPGQIIVSDDSTVWTSMGEIHEAIRIIKRDRLPQNVLVVSTRHHVYPRLWVAWHILLARKPDWHVRFATVRDFSGGMVHELAGTIQYVPRAVFHRFRSM